jgi:putative flippase GtrA
VNKDTLLNKKDIIAYFLVAASGAGIQLLITRYIVRYFSYEISVGIAYFVALIVGFGLTKFFAFDAKKSKQTQREMIKYLFVASFAGGVMVLFSSISKSVIDNRFPDGIFNLPIVQHPNALIGQITGMGFSFITNYVGHKTITFRSTGFYDKIKARLTDIED